MVHGFLIKEVDPVDPLYWIENWLFNSVKVILFHRPVECRPELESPIAAGNFQLFKEVSDVRRILHFIEVEHVL